MSAMIRVAETINLFRFSMSSYYTFSHLFLVCIYRVVLKYEIIPLLF